VVSSVAKNLPHILQFFGARTFGGQAGEQQVAVVAAGDTAV